jgi:murein DD-endopeptidase MepM/ murein hydrolase activator NlpD
MTSKNGPVAAQDSPESLVTRPLPVRARAVWPWYALLTLALATGGMWWRIGRSPLPPLGGASTTWVQAKDKQALADYLNAQVKADGFQALVHTVSKKENYWGLARSRQVDIDTVVGFNPDMQRLEAYLGRAVLLPNVTGTLHQVQPGETPASIEKDYGLDAGDLRANNRVGWLGLRAGQVLFLPDVRPRQYTPEMAQLYEGRDFLRSPLAGKFTSFVGTRTDPFTGEKRHHNGVDIKAPFNSLVAASADGRVALAGWNSGFGKCVIIDHAKGYRTLYGHLNSILVRQGEQVKQFQYIGRVGMTGRTTGPHLHFTIWKDGKLQNPLKYLW